MSPVFDQVINNLRERYPRNPFRTIVSIINEVLALNNILLPWGHLGSTIIALLEEGKCKIKKRSKLIMMTILSVYFDCMEMNILMLFPLETMLKIFGFPADFNILYSLKATANIHDNKYLDSILQSEKKRSEHP